jgi:hypothetical protein
MIVIAMVLGLILVIVEVLVDFVDVAMASVEAMAVVVEASGVAMARRNPPTMIPTSTVDIVKELVMIFTSAGSMPRTKTRGRRMIVVTAMANKAEAIRLLLGQNNTNRASFVLICLSPLM